MLPVVNLAARVLLALIFVIAGVGKITAYAHTAQYMASVGLPGSLLPFVILLEIGGGLLVVLGWQTRIAAAALAVFTLLAAYFFHMHFNDQIQTIMFLKNLSMTGGLLLLVVHGAGPLSLDTRR